jgi:hypothetical protein
MSEEETVTTTDEVDVEETPEVTEETSAEDVESEATDEPEPAEKPKPSKEQRKIAELSYKTREQNRQIERLLKAVETQSQAISTTQAPKPPKIDDFDTIEDFVDAKLEYKLSQGEAKAGPEEAPVNDDFEFAVSELYENGGEKYEDFNEVVGAENNKITPIMANAIFEIDDPDVQVDVAYLLGTDRKEALRISKLSPVRQVAAIARLEDKLASKPAPKQRTSAAPAPIKPVSGTKTTPGEIRPDDDFETFMKKRNKQLGR